MINSLLKYLVILFLLLWSSAATGLSSIKNESRNNRVGLTLSGGGARGLAHIGVLHIIDSLGIKIDYISGTSMGSIVGGMYAAGYSAAEIEEFATGLDWQTIFSSRISLEYTHPARRRDAGRYIIELPVQRGIFILPTGAIEGQQLWNVLSDIFFHVRNIYDFNDFQIPFACVATDIATGEAVVLRSGDIVAALRASMAIPSVFTTINIGERKLIDGGVVKNFPVTVVKEMGADFVIGVNVSQGLREADQLRTPVDVLYQLGFFLDARSFHENKKLTDIYLEPDLSEFTAASFNSVAEIIERGKQVARENIEQFLALKDSVSLTQNRTSRVSPAIHDQKIIIDNIHFEGLKLVRPWLVRNIINFQKGDTITVSDLNRSINRLSASGHFNRITYNLLPSEDPSLRDLVYHFNENPFGRLGMALHYSSFEGVGLIANIATNKFFLYNVNAYTKALIGEKPAFRSGIDIFTSDRQSAWFNFQVFGKHLVFPVFDNFEMAGEYRQNYLRTETTFNRLTGRNSFFYKGIGWYYQSLSPKLSTDFSIRGNIRSPELFTGWNFFSLDRHAFPRRGIKFEFNTSFYFNQRTSMEFIDSEGQSSRDLSEIDIEINNYLQFFINWASWLQVSPSLSSFNQLQAGYNVFYEQRFINMFNMGGTYPFLKNQVVFAGLNEYEILTDAVVVYTMGWQYNVWDEFMLKPLINAGLFDFKLQDLLQVNRDNFILGAGLSVGYLSAIGPLEVTLSFSPKTQKFLTYLNLGWTF